MNELEYLKAISPNNERIPDSNRPTLYAGDLEGMFNPKAPVKKTVLLDAEVLTIREGDLSVFGMVGGTVVGYASFLSDTSIDLAVVKEFRNKGIGTQILLEFRKRYPLALSGGLTLAGEKTELKVFRLMNNKAA